MVMRFECRNVGLPHPCRLQRKLKRRAKKRKVVRWDLPCWNTLACDGLAISVSISRLLSTVHVYASCLPNIPNLGMHHTLGFLFVMAYLAQYWRGFSAPFWRCDMHTKLKQNPMSPSAQWLVQLGYRLANSSVLWPLASIHLKLLFGVGRKWWQGRGGKAPCQETQNRSNSS